jgi:anti-sigma regulatory factor (Ser/Thr protein kinase)
VVRTEAERETVLPREPASVSVARRLVLSWLSERGVPAASDDVGLVITELVTNAVLHATGDHVHVRLVTRPGRFRIEVRDHYAVPPAVRPPSDEPAVGNGMHLVSRLAVRWGVAAEHDGKTVWAELLPSGASVAHATGPAPRLSQEEALRAATGRFRAETSGPEPGQVVDVRLPGLPLALFARYLERHRAMLRELTLVAARGPRTSTAPARLVLLARALEGFRGMGEATEAARADAVAQGRTTLDVTYRLPVTAGPACAHMLELLEEADEFARDEALLTLPAPPDEARVRRWFLCAIADQCAGLAPTPWTPG